MVGYVLNSKHHVPGGRHSQGVHCFSTSHTQKMQTRGPNQPAQLSPEETSQLLVGPPGWLTGDRWLPTVMCNVEPFGQASVGWTIWVWFEHKEPFGFPSLLQPCWIGMSNQTLCVTTCISWRIGRRKKLDLASQLAYKSVTVIRTKSYAFAEPVGFFHQSEVVDCTSVPDLKSESESVTLWWSLLCRCPAMD